MSIDVVDEERVMRSRPLWPFALGGALAIAVAVLAYLLWPTPSSPARVLIAVHGCSGACAQELEEALSSQLSETFETVRPDAAPSNADAAIAMAAEKGASHVLYAEVEVHERRDASPAEAAYASATVHANLLSTGDEQSREIRALR